MNTIIPDLDNDTLTYTFRKSGHVGYMNKYDIWRSINGANEQKIGTVTKTREGGWNESAYWRAESADGTYKGGGDTRQSAVQNLESRMQGPEYEARKLQEWKDERAAHAAKQAAGKAADEDLIDALMSRWPAIAEQLLPLRENAGYFNNRSVTTQQVIDLLNTLEAQS